MKKFKQVAKGKAFIKFNVHFFYVLCLFKIWVIIDSFLLFVALNNVSFYFLLCHPFAKTR